MAIEGVRTSVRLDNERESNVRTTVLFETDCLGYNVDVNDVECPELCLVQETASGGSPTYAYQNVKGGVWQMALANTTEVEDITLYMGDNLHFDDGDGIVFECRARIPTGRSMASGTDLVIGLGSARNATLDSVTEHAWFRFTDGLSILCESDDGTNDNSAVDTTLDAVAGTWLTFKIDMRLLTDVRFYVDDVAVALGTTFDISNNVTGLYQLLIELQKDNQAGIEGVDIDWIRITSNRS